MPDTITGLDDLKRTIEALPRDVTLALRAVAWQSSRRIKDRARSILVSQIRGHGRDRIHTADALVILEEDEKKQFVVTVENPEQPNLALWLERGTVYMAARPFLRPAADEETARYQHDSLAAAQSVVDRLERV